MAAPCNCPQHPVSASWGWRRSRARATALNGGARGSSGPGSAHRAFPPHARCPGAGSGRRRCPGWALLTAVLSPAARIIRTKQWCDMLPCLEGEGCDLLINRSGWTCTQPGGRIKTTTVRTRPTLWDTVGGWGARALGPRGEAGPTPVMTGTAASWPGEAPASPPTLCTRLVLWALVSPSLGCPCPLRLSRTV